MSLISSTRPWARLKKIAGEKNLNLTDLFKKNPDRGVQMSGKAADLFIDYSKNLITPEILNLLFDLAREVNLDKAIKALFEGEIVNKSERRAALHTALRIPRGKAVFFDGKNVAVEVYKVLDSMAEFTRKIHDRIWLGSTGRPIRSIVNIGIGGSDLGPKMAYSALRNYRCDKMKVYFVSNIDPTDITLILNRINPEETLFVVSSKSFTTEETMINARSARSWLIDRLKDETAVAKHFVAVSANVAEVKKFGIDEKNCFEFWDWVGGRFSLSSAIGLSLMLAIGAPNFFEMLEGFHLMDNHFATAPFEENKPVLLGLLNVWYTDFLRMQTHAVIPYSRYLNFFADYLQQLLMESLGKGVTETGEKTDYETGAIIWGGVGTDVQHSFFQLLHQGTIISPVDFIGFGRAIDPLGSQHDYLLANMLAQSQALAFGNITSDNRSNLSGNRPSTVILADRLTPKTIGELVSLYEHIVYVWGTVLGINCFDQPGVQYGKTAARSILNQMKGTPGLIPYDSSTKNLLKQIGSI
ncbi:glucose-6-phosphate isomerase [Candidatus Roizmanbacteria bacterium]|nr:glucose-6-phosphate isomerase [Candidatus Roizmanbacteria bacterium]